MGTNGTAQLSDVTKDQNWYARNISTSWRKTTECVLDTGDLLIEAKRRLPHGQFYQMIKDHLPFGPRTAQILMSIARHPVIANAKYISHLPTSWAALHELTQLPDEELEAGLQSGVINSETSVKEIRELKKRVRDEGLYLFDRLADAINTVCDFQKRWSPKQAAKKLRDTETGVSVKQVRRLPDWLDEIAEHYDSSTGD